jgi:hypothetical protein
VRVGDFGLARSSRGAPDAATAAPTAPARTAIAASERAQFMILWSSGSLLSDSGDTYVLELLASTNRSHNFFMLLNSFVSS